MEQPATSTPVKKFAAQVTIQRLWDCDALSHHRELCLTDEEYMSRHRLQVAKSEVIWVDCHDVPVTWVEEGLIQLGRQAYAVGPLDDKYHLKCVCVGCQREETYCQVNHVIRIADFTYADLRQRARAALLPDGAVIRFATPFSFPEGSYDSFRKGRYTYGTRKGGASRKTTSTVFYALETNVPYHIVHWQRLQWEIVNLPSEQEQQPGT
jgi:hypothetical protein